MRFCKQKDHFSCGPIGIINALKFQGKQVSYKDLAYISKHVKCVSPNGTLVPDMHKFIKQFDMEYIANIHIKQIDDILKVGDAVLLCHIGSHPNKHYSLIIDKREMDYYAVNYFFGATISRVWRPILVRDMRSVHGKRACGWRVKK